MEKIPGLPFVVQETDPVSTSTFASDDLSMDTVTKYSVYGDNPENVAILSSNVFRTVFSAVPAGVMTRV